jgi:hypothetical protein
MQRFTWVFDRVDWPATRATIGMKMGEIGCGSQDRQRTGYGETVTVFDLGPWTER